MKIAIDLDNTISNTKEEMNYLLNIYLKENNINEDDITKETIINFLDKYNEELINNITIKEDASKYINLLQKDNEIIIITARSNVFKSVPDVYTLTKNWLNKYQIYPDKIIINSQGETKAIKAKELNIDLAIDDDINNITEYNKYNIKTITFTNNSTWEDIYNEIKNIKNNN